MSILLKDNSDVPLLQGIKDYSRWAQHAKAELQSQNCHNTISSTPATINHDAAIVHFLDLGVAAESITTCMAVQWIETKLAKQEEQESKAIGILKKLVGAKNKQMIEDKLALEIWNILKVNFQDSSPMSQVDVV